MCCHVLGFLLRVENEELSLGFVSQNLIPERAEGIISSLAEQATSKEGGESKWGLVIVQPARAGSPQSSGCWKKQGCGQGNTLGFDAKSVLGVSGGFQHTALAFPLYQLLETAQGDTGQGKATGLDP